MQEREDTSKQKVDYYIGYIEEVLDPLLYEIKVNIPGHFEGVKAFPMRGEIDEPRVGDFVLLRSFDPIYHSYFLYSKIKENDFIGFRSNGKMIDVTPDYIEISTFDEDWSDKPGETYRPERTNWFRLDKDGNLDYSLNKNITGEVSGKVKVHVSEEGELKIDGATKVEIGSSCEVKITGETKVEVGSNCEIKITGNGTVNITGNADISVNGSTKLKSLSVDINSPNTTIHGGKFQTGSGLAAPTGTGPFCGIPTCPLTGATHVGNIFSGS